VNRTAAYRRARRAFWICVVVAVVLTGALGGVLRAPPGPATGLAVAALGLLLAAAVALAVRLLLALTGRIPPTETTMSPRRPTAPWRDVRQAIGRTKESGDDG